MLALYHNDMSLCAQKVRVCLAEKRIEWESRHLVLRAGDHRPRELTVGARDPGCGFRLLAPVAGEQTVDRSSAAIRSTRLAAFTSSLIELFLSARGSQSPVPRTPSPRSSGSLAGPR